MPSAFSLLASHVNWNCLTVTNPWNSLSCATGIILNLCRVHIKKMNTILTSNNLQPFRSHTTWIMRKLQTWPRPCSWIALWKICSLSPVSISCSITWEFSMSREHHYTHVKRCDGAINSLYQFQIDPKYNKPRDICCHETSNPVAKSCSSKISAGQRSCNANMVFYGRWRHKSGLEYWPTHPPSAPSLFTQPNHPTGPSSATKILGYTHWVNMR
jgi:hypothetical protein